MPPHFGQIVRRWESGRITVGEAAKECGVAVATFYRRVREYRLVQKKG